MPTTGLDGIRLFFSKCNVFGFCNAPLSTAGAEITAHGVKREAHIQRFVMILTHLDPGRKVLLV